MRVLFGGLCPRHRVEGSVVRTVALPTALRLLLVVAFPFGNAPASAQVITPGQEESLAVMLGKGAQLPHGCSLAAGQVDVDVVRATYHCPDGDVVIQLSYPSTRTGQAITTNRFALTVMNGSPPEELLAALEALIRSKEPDFEWSMLTTGRNARGVSSAFGLPVWFFAVLLLGLATASSISAARAWAASMPRARRAVLESLIVAASVAIWLQTNAAPPAHGDSAADVALARDCITSRGSSCLGHAASAIGLAQGQAFTYALGVWLYLGFSMRALCVVAACTHGAAIGLLHHAIARRFGGVAWVVSAFASALGVHMTGYPIIWNPSWFVLPLTVAFLAMLAIVAGSGVWSAFLAGVAFALTSESHLLFGTFVAVAAVIVLVTAPGPGAAATVLLASFMLTEVVISPVSSTLNAIVLRKWVGTHLVPATLVALLFAVSVPILLRLRRAIRDTPELRERIAVVLWLVTGAVGIGVLLPWAVSRPLQLRYYGAAFPAIGYAAGWLLDAATLRARSFTVRALAIATFTAVLFMRMTNPDSAEREWLMDDGTEVAARTGLVNASAVDIQLIVRPKPGGALSDVAAALVGTADVPVFPARIVRAVRPQLDAEPPEGWSRTRVRGGILTSAIDSWTRPHEAEICPDPPTGGPCLTLTRDDFSAVARSAGGLLHRVFGLRLARGATQIGEWNRHGTRALLWRIPLQAAGPDERRVIVVGDEAVERIAAVEGTRWTAHGGGYAVVERPAPDSGASITVRTPIAGKFEAGVPPMPFELRERELGLLQEIAPPGEQVRIGG
jgi:hypothetical protein